MCVCVYLLTPHQAKKGAAIDKWFKLQRLKPTDLVRGELHLHLAFRDGPPRKTRRYNTHTQ